METKSSAELAELEFRHSVKLLQDSIVQLPKGDPGRALLENDLRQMFNAKFGTQPVCTGGGLHWNTKTGLAAVTYMRGDASGYRTVKVADAPKPEGSK